MMRRAELSILALTGETIMIAAKPKRDIICIKTLKAFTVLLVLSGLLVIWRTLNSAQASIFFIYLTI